jgi:galactitol-specific phosphotransferase system IIC component
MDTSKKKAGMEVMKVRLSTLWIFVMLNILSADILTFLNSEYLKELMTGYADGIHITQEFLLLAAIFLEIPIAMIFLSRVLGYKVNRWANIIAAPITIAYVIAGGTTDLHYIFFATIEIVCMLLIVWYAWKWPNHVGRY